MENLTSLAAALAHPEEDSLWQIGSGDRNIVAKTLAEVARSRESHGFIRASAMTGLIFDSVYVFRTGD